MHPFPLRDDTLTVIERLRQLARSGLLFDVGMASVRQFRNEIWRIQFRCWCARALNPPAFLRSPCWHVRSGEFR